MNNFFGKVFQHESIIKHAAAGIMNSHPKIQIFLIFAVFSSPEHKVLRVSYCDRSLSVVRRRPSSVVRRASSVVRRP